MHPLISYCPAILSPGPSWGRNEYGLLQCGHQPSLLASPSGVERPTGRPQFQQNRLDSATTGLDINASSGSFSGTRGISTSPPPSLRMCESLRVMVLTVWSSISAMVASVVEATASSSCSGRKIAWVAIGRTVDDESSAYSIP